MARMRLARRSSDREDPLSREALFRQVGALVGAVLLGFLSMAARESDAQHTTLLVQVSAVTAATVVAVLFVPWRRLPYALHTLVPFVYLGVAYVARQATGGSESAYAQLVLLPVFWIAVYGTRWELAAVVLAGAGLQAAPLLHVQGNEQTWVTTIAMLCGGSAVALTVNRFFEKIRRQTTRLQAYAGTDPLTGAANRRAWDEELAASLVRAARDGAPLSVALLDLDDFKGYNDRFGHQAGDRVLKEAAAAWRSILRGSDVLARVGGDEFAVLLPGCPIDMAGIIADRLRGVVPASVRCSVGVALWDGAEISSRLLARADRALYGAKERGRDCVVVLSDGDRSAVEIRDEHVEWVRQRALDERDGRI